MRSSHALATEAKKSLMRTVTTRRGGRAGSDDERRRRRREKRGRRKISLQNATVQYKKKEYSYNASITAPRAPWRRRWRDDTAFDRARGRARRGRVASARVVARLVSARPRIGQNFCGRADAGVFPRTKHCTTCTSPRTRAAPRGRLSRRRMRLSASSTATSRRPGVRERARRPNASARRNVAFINSTCVIRAATFRARRPTPRTCRVSPAARAQTVERPRGRQSLSRSSRRLRSPIERPRRVARIPRPVSRSFAANNTRLAIRSPPASPFGASRATSASVPSHVRRAAARGACSFRARAVPRVHERASSHMSNARSRARTPSSHPPCDLAPTLGQLADASDDGDAGVARASATVSDARSAVTTRCAA